MKKKFLAILLCLAMVVSMLPSLAFAETTEVKYMTWDDTQKKLVEATCTNYTPVTGSDTEWKSTTTDGWYVVNGTISITNTVTCTGAIHLILMDYAKLTVTSASDSEAGICVTGSNSLTIYGQSGQTGELTVQGGVQAAGIGGGFECNGSNITINGGIVKATGGTIGAGIGGGNNGEGSNITINGGSVEATGGDGGAGIGGGSDGAGSSITINGGSVTATSSGDGAGIGGGVYGNGSNITINGGSVTAESGSNGAGIGGGYTGEGSNITINGGSVTATSEDGGGAGIGGGENGAGSSITINGGSVTATGGYEEEEGRGGAGIGNGHNGNASNNIKVAADIVVKTSVDNTNWTAISHNSTTDLNADFAGKGYVKTEDPSQHTIFLKGGTAYLDTDEGTDVTGIVASKGLKYVAEVPANVEEGTAAVPAHWEMNNFNFTTTAATAVEFADDGKEGNSLAINITVKGTNTIQGGNQKKEEENSIGLSFDGYYTDVTITGSGENPVLNVESGEMTAIDTSIGLDVSGNLTIIGLTANFTGGSGASVDGTMSVGAYSKALTIGNDATVTIKASECNWGGGLQVQNKIIVTGTGKLRVWCENPKDEGNDAPPEMAIVSSKQPCAKAVITPKSVSDTVIEPDWNDEDGAFMNGETYATDVTLTSPIEVGTQSGTLTYGTAGSATYSVTKYPTAHDYDAYTVLWKNADGAYVTTAPTGVTAATLGDFTDGVATLTVSTDGTTPAGSYSFIVTATDGGDVIASIPATLTVSRCSVKITNVNPNPAQHLDEITVTATAVVPEGYELVWSLGGNAKGEIVETTKNGENATAKVLAESSGDLEITAKVVDSSTGKAEVSDTAKVKVEAKYNNIIQRLMKIFKKVFINVKILLGK